MVSWKKNCFAQNCSDKQSFQFFIKVFTRKTCILDKFLSCNGTNWWNFIWQCCQFFKKKILAFDFVFLIKYAIFCKCLKWHYEKHIFIDSLIFSKLFASTFWKLARNLLFFWAWNLNFYFYNLKTVYDVEIYVNYLSLLNFILH